MSGSSTEMQAIITRQADHIHALNAEIKVLEAQLKAKEKSS